MPNLTFMENERVLAFHGPLVYEAKVLKAENWKAGEQASGATGPHYFVHYKGWKQTWDEFVPESRLLKLNEANLSKQKQLELAAKTKAADGPPASSTSGNFPTSKKPLASAGLSSSRGTKRGRDGPNTPALDGEEEWLRRPEIKINVPDVLKVHLVDDWEAVTKNSQLVPLPRTPNVQDILKAYEEETKKAANPVRSHAITHETLAGLRLYFDKCIGTNLLYRFERVQYDELREKHGLEADMSLQYGAEHLLRLFVNIPELVAHTQMDADSVNILRDALQDLLKWLVTNRKEYLLSPLEDYANSDTNYQNLARP